ncbi:MAG: metallophosphoesterase [Acidimicrobiales bacterium]
MVRWLDPHQLIDTAARVLVAGVVSSYADNRELRALAPGEVFDRSDAPDLWLDYVADLGDGWNSTFTVASLLASEELKLEWDGDHVVTERGRLLVMGGDQVYPVPKRSEYENRLLGPYRAALPCPPADEAGPELFAIPGSHDWYDGLVNFTSIFCRDRWIGGWRTRQARSYFAVALPAGWWLWAVDIQFGSYLDEGQLEYFAGVARDHLAEGDRIVVCMAKEVDSGRSGEETHSDRDIDYLERIVIQPAGARLALFLKSGKHHYARYEEEGGPRQHITAGGGGAFLHPTHGLPARMEMEGAKGTTWYRKAATYPSAAASKRLRRRIWLLPVYNLPMAGVFGVGQIVLAFMLGLHLDGRHVDLGVGGLRAALWESPTAFLLMTLILVLLAGMVRFAHDATGVTRVALGVVHSAMQLASIVVVMMAASRLAGGSLVAFLVLVGLLGGVGGTVGMSGYLWATNMAGFHGNEGYAPLHHPHHKSFLRLHIDAAGGLTVYPIGVERVGRHWELRPDDPPAAPWFVPASPIQPHLIERPVRIDP